MASSSKTASTSNEEQLPRGKACVYCRRRKMKCDGQRPICGQCSRANRPEDCEYTDGQGRPQSHILEENIARLEARIQELENPTEVDAPIMLHNPYEPAPAPAPPQPARPAPAHPPGGTVNPYDKWWATPEPPRDMVQDLVSVFLPYSSEFGFFLHPARYRNSALLHEPLGHPSRPLPALLTAVYLWGVHLSQSPALLAHEGTILSRALDQIATSLSGSHPYRVLHVLQAHILIGVYLIVNGRFLEGKYHVSAAVSLAVSSGLHKIRSAQPAAGAQLLPPPRNTIEDGERIRALWTVVVLDDTWAVAFSMPANMTWLANTSSAQVDSPWPEEMDVYEQRVQIPADVDSMTLQRFLTDAPQYYPPSTLALLAQAAVLWERSRALTNRWRTDLSHQEAATFAASFTALNQRIENFRSSLVPPGASAGLAPETMRGQVVAQSIAHAATIQLYSIFQGDAGARQTSVGAGMAIVNIIGAVPLAESAYINPIMGTVWMSACQTLIGEIARLQALRLAGSAEAAESEHQVQAALIFGFGAMSTFANTFPLMKFQLGKIQEAYASI